MKAPYIRINQVKTLVLSKSLGNALGLLPDKVYPFIVHPNDNSIDIMIFPSEYFTGCWLAADTHPKSKAHRFKAGRGEALANVFNIQGFKNLTNYKVVDIIPKVKFTITKEVV